MNLTEYHKQIAALDGQSIPPPDPVGVTRQEFDFREPGNEGSATVLFFEGKPFAVNYHSWSMSREYVARELQRALSLSAIRLLHHTGGNGHYSADLDVSGQILSEGELDVVYPWDEDMDEISGLGRGYEEVCRYFCQCTVDWLDIHPVEAANICRTHPDQASVQSAIQPLLTGLDAIFSEEHASGLQVDGSTQMGCYAYRQGWAKFRTDMQERKKKDAK